MTSDDVEVLVIGAGLAGLRCAGVLAAMHGATLHAGAAGREVRVWETSDDVGGRVCTDVVDGFLCDRGFQVLNPAYPELGRAVDIAALRLQPFRAGVAVRREHDAALFVHPLRRTDPGCRGCSLRARSNPARRWRSGDGSSRRCDHARSSPGAATTP